MNTTGEANKSTAVQSSLLQSATGCAVNLYNHFQSATAFLICSGPSLKGVDLSCLQSRGILTCTVNNAGTLLRSNLWVAYDNPGNFCDVIWRDPAIWKFIPKQRLDMAIRTRSPNGDLEDSTEAARTMPATFGYKTNRCFRATHWLSEDSINCGDTQIDDDVDEPSGTRSVMLAALRLLHYLGVRKVFLLGCDFRMSYSGENYAFEQFRTRRSVRGNNYKYRVLTERLKELKPHFDTAGFEVLNCTPNSGLTVFPFVEFDEAVRIAKQVIPDQILTKGMYAHGAY